MNIKRCSILAAATLLFTVGSAYANKTKTNAPAAPNVVDVNSGQIDIMLDKTFSAVLAAGGIIDSYHGTTASVPSTSPAGTRGFRIYGGEVDTNSGEGEFESVGDLQFNNGTTVLELRHLTLDTTGSVPVISAEVLVNNALTGRVPVFTLVVDDLFPIPPSGPTISTPTVPMAMNDTFVTFFNSLFNSKIMFLGLGAGSASVTATTGTIP